MVNNKIWSPPKKTGRFNATHHILSLWTIIIYKEHALALRQTVIKNVFRNI